MSLRQTASTALTDSLCVQDLWGFHNRRAKTNKLPENPKGLSPNYFIKDAQENVDGHHAIQLVSAGVTGPMGAWAFSRLGQRPRKLSEFY